MAKYTLLEIVQKVLSDMDSEEVNSISDSAEAMQVASLVEDVYFGMVNTRHIPEHYELLRLTPLANPAKPTHFQMEEDVRRIDNLWYERSTGGYRTLEYVDPLTFLSRTDGMSADYDTVTENNTKLRVRNNEDPSYYTIFDDEYVICNAYDSAVEDTLQLSKVRAYGVKTPTFTVSDTFVPDIDISHFNYLIEESKSRAMSVFKSGVDAKTEQAARRQRYALANDKYRQKQTRRLSVYGR